MRQIAPFKKNSFRGNMPIPLAMCSKPGDLKFPRKLYPNDMFEYEVTRLSEDNI